MVLPRDFSVKKQEQRVYEKLCYPNFVFMHGNENCHVIIHIFVILLDIFVSLEKLFVL